ncbi:CPBP family intramembrane metalloprotease [Peptoniphilus sp. MSJ-1]|uniref:CPBP family intramembrane metalloprotease n=1 Tax=Peptoniphilus ovalis TaxID=2841503 RepID=A0ABS6FEE5_9FIRM|nr:type II CAAX endopeptidase family protein [Peptoniphilus ovalis]MBU5668549.1 CPBP family intramembrane metalloprotease [Peptoniphilus ovalis]
MKKDLKVFLAVSFIIPFIMDFLIYYCKLKGIGYDIYPLIQMFFPFLGAMAVMKSERKDILKLSIFKIYSLIVIINIFLGIFNLFNDDIINLLSSFLVLIGSVVTLILLLLMDKEKRVELSLNNPNIKITLVFCVYFIISYFLRGFISFAVEGKISDFIEILSADNLFKPIGFILTSFLVFLPFIGEEYGWRAYLTPRLNEIYGHKKALFISGFIWGIWHLPLNLFYYSESVLSSQILSIFNQIGFCIFLGIFLSYAYNRTGSIWTAVIIHLLNNNMAVIYSNTNSSNVIRNNHYDLKSTVTSIILAAIFYGIFIFSRYIKNEHMWQSSIYEDINSD